MRNLVTSCTTAADVTLRVGKTFKSCAWQVSVPVVDHRFFCGSLENHEMYTISVKCCLYGLCHWACTTSDTKYWTSVQSYVLSHLKTPHSGDSKKVSSEIKKRKKEKEITLIQSLSSRLLPLSYILQDLLRPVQANFVIDKCVQKSRFCASCRRSSCKGLLNPLTFLLLETYKA